MLLPKPCLGLVRRYAFVARELLHTSSDGCECFGAIQTIEHLLITCRVLDDKLRGAVHSEDLRGLPFLEAAGVYCACPSDSVYPPAEK